jgi:CheY-like chemotaxis protein
MNSQTILLVEDDPDDQIFFISALRGIENTTSFESVNNGKEAIEWLYKADILPRIIFMDIHMPVMNGIECLLIMAKDPSMNTVPIVMLSADIGLREKARLAGANGFIRKNTSVVALREEIEHILFKFNYKEKTLE